MRISSYAHRILLTAMLTFLASNAVSQDQSELLDLRLQIHDALDRLERGQTGTAEGMLLDAQRSPYFPLLDRDYHDYVNRGLLAIAAASGDLASRYADLLRLSQTSNNPQLFVEVIRTAQSLDNHVDSIRSLIVFAERWPDQLPLIGHDSIADALLATRSLPDMPVSFDELVSKLDTAVLSGGDLGFISQCWREFALRSVELGDLETAAVVFEKTLSVDVLITMLIDARFDAIWEAFPDAVDLQLAMAREVDWARKFLIGNPHRIESVRAVASTLRRADLLDEALTLIDSTIEQILAPDADPDSWIDLQEQFNWLINDRADVLLELGRVQESADQLMAAAELPERGQRNVSQTINYASRLVDLGRLDEAEEALSRVGRMSEFGEMTRNLLELSIATQRGEERRMRRLIDDIEEHESVSLSRLQGAYMVIGDLDAAARILIQRLQDVSERYGALMSLQYFIRRWARADVPENVRLLESRLELLRDRQDVKEALDEVGRVREFALRL